jgi:predicted DNA-binding transcriptional regulator AlpA
MTLATAQSTSWGTDRLLTPAEVAGHLGIKIQTLYAWRVRSCGPRAMRVGKYLRYRLSDVEAWQEANLDPRVA